MAMSPVLEPKRHLMQDLIGKTLDVLDSPQAVIDLDVVDANLKTMLSRCAPLPINLRVHFKSLKCAGLALYLTERGVQSFLCAKLNEAEVLVDHGIKDVFIANQIVGPLKLRRLADLALRASLRVCVDNAQNVRDLGAAIRAAGASVGALVEVDIGMARCGVEPGEQVLILAQQIASTPGLRFVGLQGYDGHLQMLGDAAERRRLCLQGLAKLKATRTLIENAGLTVDVVTGAGTGTWEFVGADAGVTEIQPGSFVLMDSAYHEVKPEFSCALAIMTTVVSCHPNWYVLDAGSKAISKDFGMPVIQGRPRDRVDKLSEEHTKVESAGHNLRIGDRIAVVPTHGCATMNLHRQCVAMRKGKIEKIWPIEASGRYD
jgi:D-serine deaminase-like pyridoxal phosphate-dependent protein